MLDRLKILERNILELQAAKKRLSLSALSSELREQWALRYGLLESIQIIIDISCHLVSKFNLGNPQSYRECIELLQQNAYISPGLSTKLKSMVGLRNILVHDYIAVDDAQLYELLGQVDDMSEFVQACVNHLQ
ncbi:MAG: DUF86 domain-containing protein [Ignavibacteriae bacterium]|nr:DUF86 domain-containing protein [Ignavibacteriota bacterium]